MRLHTNDLWVLQELEDVDMYVEDRRRKGKLIFVYDYVSQFILQAKFFFLIESNADTISLFDKLWRYGIPKTVLIETERMLGENWLQVAHVLGIQVWKTEEKRVDLDTGSIKEQWGEKIKTLTIKKYRNFKEFRKHVNGLILEWNQQNREGREKNSRLQEYDKQLCRHIFLEREVLRESYLIKYKSFVTAKGNIQVLHRIYQVPEQYKGKWIEIRVSLIYKQEIYIYDETRNLLIHRCPLVAQL
ncbi:hypothetical protein [[Clostridium] polysaccharolyticum]|uniref:Integrase catalytic domain-containing protein n=1 Tax=[Clostridium] polysaccharolyticum TaxID=29364 RepID=A0A1I0CYS0_9FIRM|nr:hypothetical protein [[Clostridium] polysaccharolyticum]SET24931.1 hypothetical protein SAMN04487772_11223 [[Clostridium] polysaccharolyticum]